MNVKNESMSPRGAAMILDGILESGAITLTRSEKEALRMGATALLREAANPDTPEQGHIACG